MALALAWAGPSMAHGQGLLLFGARKSCNQGESERGTNKIKEPIIQDYGNVDESLSGGRKNLFIQY